MPGVRLRANGTLGPGFVAADSATIDVRTGNWMVRLVGAGVVPVKDFELVEQPAKSESFKKGDQVTVRGGMLASYTVLSKPHWDTLKSRWMVHLVGGYLVFLENCELLANLPPEQQLLRPPLGIKPRYIADTERAQEILAGMIRYVGGNPPLRIPDAWIHELQEINDRTKPKA